MPKVRSIESFFDNEYLAFARYSVEQRAIPSGIDGFKPTQRKVAQAANRHWKRGDEKPLKVFQLAGTVAATTYYHHGNASLESCIIGMAQDFKNSMPIFQGIGQFGSLRSPEAGAPRYVSVKFNDSFRLLYKDFDLLDKQYEEGEEIEPKFFLPIIPTVLLNGGSGIAVGFASKILNRNPLDLIDACIDHLLGRPVKQLTPWIRGFSGTFTRVPENPRSWIIRGKYEVKNTSTVEVTEVPPSYTYEKYEKHLAKLEETGKITSYDDMSSGQVRYVIKMARQKLTEYDEKGKLEDLLHLSEKETENFTTLDQNGQLKIFESAEEIVRFFVDFRLGYYQKRKDRIIEILEKDLQVLVNRLRFIKAVIEKSIEIAGVKREVIENRLAEIGCERLPDQGYDYLLGLAIHTLTKEKYDDLLLRESQKRDELDKIRKSSPDELYLADLRELRAKIAKK
jgi:DNA topoisomerase II